MADEKDQRPDIAKDDEKTPRKDVKEHWHNAEETMSEAPGGQPERREAEPHVLTRGSARPSAVVDR